MKDQKTKQARDRLGRALAGSVVIAVLGFALSTAAKPLTIASQGYFFVGGRYQTGPSTAVSTSTGGDDPGRIMDGQMFVQFQKPARLRHPYPIVMIHGAGQSGVNFLGTPDGRPGWADYFLRQGYAVYVVDQVFRGRSAYHAQIDGPLQAFSVTRTERQFTHPESAQAWPTASKHDKWPGRGVEGDATFDQFFASQLDSSSDNAKVDVANADAGAALLDRIGPAILLTHSRGGAFGWLIADRRPTLVKAIVAIEPWGPPFGDVTGAAVVRPWGLTAAPLIYSTPLSDPADLSPTPPAAGRECWSTPSRPRSLANLKRIPVTLVTAEASYHAAYDHCTVEYLRSVGVKTNWLELRAHGLHGNGHMMMLERNSDRIAALIAQDLNAVR